MQRAAVRTKRYRHAICRIQKVVSFYADIGYNIGHVFNPENVRRLPLQYDWQACELSGTVRVACMRAWHPLCHAPPPSELSGISHKHTVLAQTRVYRERCSLCVRVPNTKSTLWCPLKCS